MLKEQIMEEREKMRSITRDPPMGTRIEEALLSQREKIHLKKEELNKKTQVSQTPRKIAQDK